MGREPRQWLKTIFEARKKRNQLYSVRAFAMSLGISPGQLSRYLALKRKINPAVGAKMADQLGLPDEQRVEFLEAIRYHWEKNVPLPDHELSACEFKAIAEPIHFNLLNLIETNEFNSDMSWIAQRLGIEPEKVETAIERLVQLNMVKFDGSKIVKTCGQFVSIDEDRKNAAIREHHKENLTKVCNELEQISVNLRDLSSITLSTDLSKIEKAKEMICKFRREFMKEMESGERKEVYQLNISFTPVTKIGAQ